MSRFATVLFMACFFLITGEKAQSQALGTERSAVFSPDTPVLPHVQHPISSGLGGLQFLFGADIFRQQQGDIHGINNISIVYAFPSGFYLGNSVYSSAFGSGGGFFVGGIETGFRMPLSTNTMVQAGFFAGGGGGANQVNGDGLMLRSNASVAYQFAPGWRVMPGLSYVSVSGSSISSTAFSIGISRDLNLALSEGHADRPVENERSFRITAFKPLYRLYRTGSSEKRGIPGRPLEDMHTIGAEITFSNTDWYEVFVQTHGVVAGDAEGYADWLVGYRVFWNIRPFRLSASLGTGSAGGGAVNSGGGQVYLAGAGINLPAWRRLGLEVEAMTLRSFNGDFTTFAPGIRLVRYLGDPFHAAEPVSYRWSASTGTVLHIPNSTYRKFGDRRGPLVFMIEAALDLMLGEQFYITGRGYTSFIGDAGGYQIGLLGPGFILPLPNNWYLKTEAYIGAGGGARVDTQGGLLTGARAEIGLPVWQSLHFVAGAGTLRPVLGRGMNPLTLHAGLSIPFRTYH